MRWTSFIRLCYEDKRVLMVEEGWEGNEEEKEKSS